MGASYILDDPRPTTYLPEPAMVFGQGRPNVVLPMIQKLARDPNQWSVVAEGDASKYKAISSTRKRFLEQGKKNGFNVESAVRTVNGKVLLYARVTE